MAGSERLVENTNLTRPSVRCRALRQENLWKIEVTLIEQLPVAARVAFGSRSAIPPASLCSGTARIGPSREAG
jgi:hypothetical protein